jgi:hypothetical protein
MERPRGEVMQKLRKNDKVRIGQRGLIFAPESFVDKELTVFYTDEGGAILQDDNNLKCYFFNEEIEPVAKEKEQKKINTVKRIFISQPMKDKTDREITIERTEAINLCAEKYCGTGFKMQIIDSFFDDANPITLLAKDFNALGHLGMSLLLLSKADAAYFIDGWEDARGCRIEHDCCEAYGIEIIKD